MIALNECIKPWKAESEIQTNEVEDINNRLSCQEIAIDELPRRTK